MGTRSFTLDSELFALDGTSAAEVDSTSALSKDSTCVAVDSIAGTVYAGTPKNTVSTAVTGEIATFSATTLASQKTYAMGAGKLAFDGAGTLSRLYLLDNDESTQSPGLRNSIGILDPAKGSLAKITIGYTPGQIAINPSTNRIYVADLKAPEVVVLDGAGDTIIAHVPVAPRDETGPDENSKGFRPLLVSIDRNRFYITHAARDPATGLTSSYVDEYDGETNELIKSILVNTDYSATFAQIAIDDTRHHLYAKGVESVPSSRLFLNIYDLTDDSLLTRLSFNYCNDIALDPITGLIYITGGYLQPDSIYDPISQAFLGTVPSGMIPTDITVNAQTHRAYSVGLGSNAVFVINRTEAETSISGTADSVISVAVDDLTNTIFLGSTAYPPDPKGWVGVYDGNNNYLFAGQIEVGRYPQQMAFNTASRELFVSNFTDGTLSILQSTTPAQPDHFANISTRLGVETGDNVLIGGFIISGPAGSTKQVLVRGIGPSLTAFGVTGALADPVLELHNASNIIATNHNWKLDPNGKSQQTAIEATSLQPTNDQESAILINLAPGSYTAVMRGVNDGTGVGLVEVYDVTADDTIKMVNISTRGRVETGDSVMIGGIIVTGSNPSRVLLRAIGPSLGDFGVTGALADPVLELYNSDGDLIVINDNWQEENKDAIVATGLAPANNKESAILTTLYPSSYTAIVRGKSDTTGVGLVEAYYLP